MQKIIEPWLKTMYTEKKFTYYKWINSLKVTVCYILR